MTPSDQMSTFSVGFLGGIVQLSRKLVFINVWTEFAAMPPAVCMCMCTQPPSPTQTHATTSHHPQTYLEAMPPSPSPSPPGSRAGAEADAAAPALQDLWRDVVRRPAHGALPLPGARHARGQAQVAHLLMFRVLLWGGVWGVWCGGGE